MVAPLPNRSAQEVLQLLMDLPEADRREAAGRYSGGDAGLEQEVHRLLDLLPEAEGYFDRFACPSILDRRAGNYRILAELGAGGMGTVYRAERADGEFSREVAVKLLSVFSAGGEAWRRFQSEKRILARLKHPNIAALLDAGSTEEGIPYLVMELVEGVPIDRYCQERQLDVGARLRLFQQICQAVHFAHQNLVVHRDIKPANILVTSDGIPKLLDFGISKSLAPEADAGATRPESRLMTLRYASPEQVRGEPVTTVSDVCSLGLVLYEMLAGRPAYRPEGRPLAETLRMVCDEDPPTPGGAAELDNIVMKAIRKAPSERYASARELAADLENYLSGRPVTAVQPTRAYRARKWIGRNKVGVSLGAAVAAALLVAVGFVLWEARVAVDAGRAADAQRARAEAARRASEEQRERAERNERLAEKNRGAAEQRFEEVRTLANRVLFDYQTELASLGAASALRARMAADSLRYLDALAADRTTDRGLQVQVARGYRQIATVQGVSRFPNLGDEAGAHQSLLKAKAILEDLLRQDPHFRPARVEMGFVLELLSRVDPGNRALAARSLSQFQALHRESPRNRPILKGLGYAYIRLAELEEPVRYGSEAVKVLQAAARLEPDVAWPLSDLALAHRLVATGYVNRSAFGPGIAHAQRAKELDERAIRILGNPASRRMELSFDFSLLGKFEQRLGHFPAAREHFGTALQLQKDVYAANPQDSFVRHRLIATYSALSAALENLDDWSGAEACYREAIAQIPVLTGGKAAAEVEPHLFWIHAGYALLLNRQHTQPEEACRQLQIAQQHRARLEARGEKVGNYQPARDQQAREAMAACAEAKTAR